MLTAAFLKRCHHVPRVFLSSLFSLRVVNLLKVFSTDVDVHIVCTPLPLSCKHCRQFQFPVRSVRYGAYVLRLLLGLSVLEVATDIAECSAFVLVPLTAPLPSTVSCPSSPSGLGMTVLFFFPGYSLPDQGFDCPLAHQRPSRLHFYLASDIPGFVITSFFLIIVSVSYI